MHFIPNILYPLYSFCTTTLLVWAVILAPLSARTEAQTPTDNIVRNKLRQVALGNGAVVRAELPSLLRDYPNDAGIQFLNATLTVEGNKSLPMFERIVREHPESSWADDAQWRIVQIFSLRKDTLNARSELQRFRKNYPSSEFLLFAAEIVKSTVGLPASFVRGNAIVASTTNPPASSFKNVPPTASVASTPAPTTTAPPTAKASTMPTNPPTATTPKSTVAPATNTPTAATPKPTGASPTSTATQAPPPATSTQPSATGTQKATERSTSAERYTLQVGLYSSREHATVEMQKFIKARMRADVLEKSGDKLNGEQSRYAVTVGEYSSRESAEKARSVVQKVCQCTPFIVSK